MGNLYIGLLHYPVRNREGEVVTAALTGLDIHDIARAARTYGVKQYYLVTPLLSQQGIAARIKRYWVNTKVGHTRGEALKIMEIVGSFEDAVSAIQEAEGIAPTTVGTSARELIFEQIGYKELRERIESFAEPVYLLFGTGWGLADQLLERLDYLLPPICGPTDWNHLSVRAAVATTLDRLRGRRDS